MIDFKVVLTIQLVLYATIMEQSVYVFERKENNRRQLTEQDLLALNELKKLIQIMTLEEACLRVIQFIPKGKAKGQASR